MPPELPEMAVKRIYDYNLSFCGMQDNKSLYETDGYLYIVSAYDQPGDI